MFRIKMKVIDELTHSSLHFKANTTGGFINIPHEKLETEAYLEPDNSKSVFVLKTNSFENNIRYEIDFPLTEDGIEKYVDYVVLKVESEEKTKAFNNLYNILNFVFGGPTLKIHLSQYHNQQIKTKLTDIKNFIDKNFEKLRAKMPENLKNIELNNDWFGPITAKIMLSKPIIIPEVEEANHKIDALNYFIETELERLKKEKNYMNNMNKKALLTGDFFPLSPKGICLVVGSRGDGKQFETAKLNGQEKLVQPKKPRPDSIMIDEEHRIVVAFLNGKRYVAECHDLDKFDFRIGLGNIVSKCNDANAELQYLRKKMKWNEYYLYCYNKFFYFNQERIKAFENSVLAEKEQFKLRVNEEKVKQYKAELNGEKYRMKKVCHNFIEI